MQVLFTSNYGNLSVGHPKHTGEKNWEGKYYGYRPIVFKDGRLVLDDVTDKDLIEVLNKHPGNEANGGSSFKKQTDDIQAILAIEKGETWASVPANGIIDADIQALKYLDKLGAQLSPNAMKRALDLAVTVYDRFGLRGMAKPAETDKPKRLRAKITEIVETIKDRGIWNDDSEGQEHSGQGTEKD